MRTTLSLEPDVAALIASEVQASRKSMKTVVNGKLRRGFAAVAQEKHEWHFSLPSALDLGQPKVQNFDNIAEILESIENDSR